MPLINIFAATAAALTVATGELPDTETHAVLTAPAAAREDRAPQGRFLGIARFIEQERGEWSASSQPTWWDRFKAREAADRAVSGE